MSEDAADAGADAPKRHAEVCLKPGQVMAPTCQGALAAIKIDIFADHLQKIVESGRGTIDAHIGKLSTVTVKHLERPTVFFPYDMNGAAGDGTYLS
jgi:hypothetical protein